MSDAIQSWAVLAVVAVASSFLGLSAFVAFLITLSILMIMPEAEK